jgi:hypothetical protein
MSVGRSLCLLVVALLIAGCTGLRPHSNPPDVSVPSPVGFGSYVLRIAEEINGTKPGIAVLSPWHTSVTQGVEDIERAELDVRQATPMVGVGLVAEARALFAAASENDEHADPERIVNVTALEGTQAEVVSLIDSSRNGSVSADGLAYMAVAEEYEGTGVEFLENTRTTFGHYQASGSASDGQDAILAFHEADSAFWLAGSLANESQKYAGSLLASRPNETFVRLALEAPARLPEKGPSSAVSAYMLAKRRIPVWLTEVDRQGWGEGAVLLSAELLVESNAALRYAAGEGENEPRANADAALRAIGPTLASPLDDIHGQRAWHFYLQGNDSAEWFVLVEEEANIAEMRMLHNRQVLGGQEIPEQASRLPS